MKGMVVHDQANELRALVRGRFENDDSPGDRPPLKIVVAGGKGGVGATTVAVNLAVALARLGRRTVLVDADLSGAHVARLCRIEPRESIADVLEMKRTIHEVLVRGPAGVQVLPAAWAPVNVPIFSVASRKRLLRELDLLGRHADTIVLDVGSGLNDVVQNFWQAADLIVLVTTAESAAIMDSYAAVKIFQTSTSPQTVCTLVNRAPNAAAAENVHARIAAACRRFLGLNVQTAGELMEDSAVRMADAAGQPFVIQSPQCLAATAMERAASRVMAIAAPLGLAFSEPAGAWRALAVATA